MKLYKIEPDRTVGKRLRVCAYARVSSMSDKQENSLENQVTTYEKYIRSNPRYEFAGVYADRGITGGVDRRPQFQKMMEVARSGMFDLVITKSISRFARNTVTLLTYVRELKTLGIGVFFEEHNINTLSSEGEMMLTVLASFAQEESRSMSENNKWTIRKKFERGELMINTERFMGYDKDENGSLIINEAEADIVRRVFNMYLSGYGAHRIVKELNAEGVATVGGKAWHTSTILGMLKNEKYKGDSLLQKYYTPENRHHTKLNTGQVQQYYVAENHEPIIAPDDWEQVQKLIDYNKEKHHIKSGDPCHQIRYPNSHKLVCPYCGKYLRRIHAYKNRIEWLCSTYIEQGKTVCKGIRIKDSELSGRIFSESTVVEEVVVDGSKHYSYTRKADYDNGSRTGYMFEESCSLLPRVN